MTQTTNQTIAPSLTTAIDSYLAAYGEPNPTRRRQLGRVAKSIGVQPES